VGGEEAGDDAPSEDGAVKRVDAAPATSDQAVAEPEEEETGLKPLSERLVSDLTAWRTLALQDAFAQSPDTAYVAVLHAFVLSRFYGYAVPRAWVPLAHRRGQAPGAQCAHGVVRSR
jgi:ParB family chromosome partitioning protein